MRGRGHGASPDDAVRRRTIHCHTPATCVFSAIVAVHFQLYDKFITTYEEH